MPPESQLKQKFEVACLACCVADEENMHGSVYWWQRRSDNAVEPHCQQFWTASCHGVELDTQQQTEAVPVNQVAVAKAEFYCDILALQYHQQWDHMFAAVVTHTMVMLAWARC